MGSLNVNELNNQSTIYRNLGKFNRLEYKLSLRLLNCKLSRLLKIINQRPPPKSLLNIRQSIIQQSLISADCFELRRSGYQALLKYIETCNYVYHKSKIQFRFFSLLVWKLKQPEEQQEQCQWDQKEVCLYPRGLWEVLLQERALTSACSES